MSKTKILIISLTALAVCGVAGALIIFKPFGENPENAIIRDVEGEIQFDFDEALDNIYIRCVKTGFPKTPADFGEGFNLGEFPRSFEEFTAYGHVSWSGDGVSTVLKYIDDDFGVGVILRDCTVKDYSVNSEILSITFDTLTDDSELYGIYGFRIGDKATIDDIKAFLGEPTTENVYTLYYEQEKPFIRFVSIKVGESGKITEIGVKN